MWSWEGALLAVLEGHQEAIQGVLELAGGQILSWSGDFMQGTTSSLRLWSRDGGPVTHFEGHTGFISGVRELADGRILSWSDDGTLRFWSSGLASSPRLQGHFHAIADAKALPDGRWLSWALDGTLGLWSADGSHLANLAGHTDKVTRVEILRDGGILSWCSSDLLDRDHSVRIWSAQGECLVSIDPVHDDCYHLRNRGALEMADGQILSWNGEPVLRLWSKDGVPLGTMEGHAEPVWGATLLADHGILTWDVGGTLVLRTAEGSPRVAMRGAGKFIGVHELADGRILSWAIDGQLCLWSGTGALLDRWVGYSSHPEARIIRDGIKGAILLQEGLYLEWSSAGMFVGPSDTGEAWKLEGHEDDIERVTEWPDGRILSSGRDGTLRLWSRWLEPLAVLGGHDAFDATALADGRLLSWRGNRGLHLWSATGLALEQWPGLSAPDDMLAAKLRAEGRGLLVQHGVPVRTYPTSVLAAGAVWHATSALNAQAFQSDGTIVVSLDNGQLSFLQLMHGRRRIDAREAILIGRECHAIGPADRA